jgi:hypothetical protein
MIEDYAPFFMKRVFDVPDYKKKRPKKTMVLNDYLFYSFFYKINNIDITSYDKYNEKQEKVKLAEKLDKMKFKNKDFIMNNLLYDKTIHLMTLNILCIHYSVSVIFIIQNAYYKMNVSDKDILYMNSKYEFISFDGNLNNYYEITQLDKPLYSISYYTVADLIDICNKLKLPHDNMKKQNVYNNILSYLINFNIYKID